MKRVNIKIVSACMFMALLFSACADIAPVVPLDTEVSASEDSKDSDNESIKQSSDGEANGEASESISTESSANESINAEASTSDNTNAESSASDSTNVESSASDSINADTTPSDSIVNEPASEPTVEAPIIKDGPRISLAATDIYGNEISEDYYKGAKVVLLNLWEPWCGPCVREMPDLQELYEDYKDKGLIIAGAYFTFSMDADAEYIVSAIGIDYPILRGTAEINTLSQEYVPATYLLDGDGYLLEEDPYIGSGSYNEWESIILKYLE